MALTNPKKFGLEVRRALADVVNPRVALRNLNISTFDLEVIHKSSVANPSVDFDDFRSLSRLTSPIWKTLDRFNSDSGQYGSLLINRAGIDGILFGGLKINGKLSGAAIRYRYIAGSGATTAVDTINAAPNNPYTPGTYNNRYAWENVDVTVTKSSGLFSSITITVLPGLDHTYSTNTTGLNQGGSAAGTDHYAVQTAYPVTINSAKARVNSTNNKILEIEDTLNGDDDYNDLVVTMSKGRFYESGGSFFYILDIESEMVGNGKATFNVEVDGNGISTTTLGTNKGDGYSVGDFIVIRGYGLGGGDITVTVTGTGSDPFRTAIADISTSRVSAWSSSVPEPIPATAPISYGAQISVRSGGQLKFGTQSGSGLATGPRLKTTIVPSPRRFASEIPTSKIKCKINGSDIEFYAMKGIPCIFEGYFRNINGSCEFSAISGLSISPSWLIVEQNNRNNQTAFENQKSFSFNSVRSRERFIELYYPPDKIIELNLNSTGISGLPSSRFDILTKIYLANNRLRNFPNFTSITPIAQVLNISRNYFNLGEVSTERKLNSNIAAKIPNTLTQLEMGATFYGSIQQNIFKGVDYPNLTSFSLRRSGGPYFHPDSDDTVTNSCTVPNVGDTVTSYDIHGNDFRRFDTSNTSSSVKAYNVKDLPNLLSADLGGNYYLADSGFSIASNVINSLSIYSTGLPCPNMQNKTSFNSLSASYTRNFGTLFANESGGVYTGYKFEGCVNLTNLTITRSGLSGPLPEFDNPGLTTINFDYTSIAGGNPAINGGGDYVIPRDTIKSCPNLQTFNILSGNLLRKSIHEDAFTDATELRYLRIYSYRRVTGEVPKLNSCTKLNQINLHYNDMEGSIPNFASSPNIQYVYFHENRFSGTIPKFQNLSSLYHLYLQNNSFTGLLEFVNLPNLDRFYCHNNNISGEIPDFTECPKLRYLAMYNNNFTSYKLGAFKDLNRVRYIDCSLNNLTQTSVNDIVDDLYDNYTAVPRGGVTINIKNNVGIGASLPTIPSEDQIDKINILKTKGWNFVYL